MILLHGRMFLHGSKHIHMVRYPGTAGALELHLWSVGRSFYVDKASPTEPGNSLISADLLAKAAFQYWLLLKSLRSIIV